MGYGPSKVSGPLVMSSLSFWVHGLRALQGLRPFGYELLEVLGPLCTPGLATALAGPVCYKHNMIIPERP